MSVVSYHTRYGIVWCWDLYHTKMLCSQVCFVCIYIICVCRCAVGVNPAKPVLATITVGGLSFLYKGRCPQDRVVLGYNKSLEWRGGRPRLPRWPKLALPSSHAPTPRAGRFCSTAPTPEDEERRFIFVPCTYVSSAGTIVVRGLGCDKTTPQSEPPGFASVCCRRHHLHSLWQKHVRGETKEINAFCA